GRQAIGALRRPDDGELADLLPARQIADRYRVADLMFEGQRRLVDGDVLRVDVAIAEIIAAIDTGDHPTRDGVVRHAILRDIVIFLMQILQGQAGRAADTQRDRRSDTPAFIFLDVATRHVILVYHRVKAKSEHVAGADIGVDRTAIII